MYRNRIYQFYKSIGVLLWLFCLFLQSCSVSNRKLGVNYITVESLDEDRRRPVRGVFPGELWRNIQNLTGEGFIGGDNVNNNVNVKKHLMFVFYHCLRLKQESTVDNVVNSVDMMQNILDFFLEDEDAEGLMFTPVDVLINDQRVGIRFILKNFLTNNDPNRVDNVNMIGDRRSPMVYIMDGRFLVEGNDQELVGDEDLERMDVDHLLRDNIITIELPAPVHHIKTRLLDKLTSSLGEDVVRNPQRYWRIRLREL